MRGFHKSDFHKLETELRKNRPEPRSAFLSQLASDARGRTRASGVGRRVALAAALTVGMLTLFASFGGVGYATSAADSFSVTKMARIIGVAPKAKHAKKAKKHVRRRPQPVDRLLRRLVDSLS